MDSLYPLNRRIEILVGPLKEWETGGNAEVALRFVGDGTPNGFRIKCHIEQHMVSTSTPTTVTIYNLSQKLREALRSRQAKIVIRAGWENIGITEIFTGTIQNVVSQREGADIVTTISALAGAGATARALLSKTFAGGSALKDVVIQVAKTLPGVTVDPKLVSVPSYALGKGGYSFVGDTKEALDRLARVYGFSWWIKNNKFHALNDKSAYQRTVEVSAANGYLLRAEPMLASPFQMQSGVSISCLFHPEIEAGVSVKLVSEISPQLNGTYKIHNVIHSLDTHSSAWESSIDNFMTV